MLESISKIAKSLEILKQKLKEFFEKPSQIFEMNI